VEQADWTLTALESGEVAAKAVYLSNEPFLIRGREHQFLLLTPQSAGIDLFGNMLFFVPGSPGCPPRGASGLP
jgi:hypothetical protein